MSFTCSCSCSVTKTMRIVTSLWLIAATIWSQSRVRVCLFCWKGLKQILSRVPQVACSRYDMWDDLRTTSPDYVCGDMGEVLELREGLSWRRAFFLGLEIFFVRKTEALFQVSDWGVLPVQFCEEQERSTAVAVADRISFGGLGTLYQVIIINNKGLGTLSAMQFCGEEAAAVLVWQFSSTKVPNFSFSLPWKSLI